MECQYIEGGKNNYSVVPQTQIASPPGEIKMFCISDESANCPIFPVNSLKSVDRNKEGEKRGGAFI